MKRLQGIAAAPGYAIGPAFQFRAADLRIERRSIGSTDDEVKRLEAALAAAGSQMQAVLERARQEMPSEQAAIFEAQLMMLQDPQLTASIRRTIQTESVNAEYTVREATENYALKLEAMPDPYFRARAADVRDIARRILRILLGAESTDLSTLPRPCVILAQDLAPSETIVMDKSKVLGFCTVGGSETSHTAILARGLGIPAVVGCGAELVKIAAGTELVLDGTAGEVLVSPTQQVLKQYRAKSSALEASLTEANAQRHQPAITQDGRQLEVVANIGGLSAARSAVESGAEGVGLLRTEFLYLERQSLPDEEEQTRAYQAILDVFGQKPVVLRTMDIGGDKAIPYLGLPQESNPFLGVRGLRLCLRRPDLFKPQLRAALRASVGHNLKIMFPMVAAVDEVRRARDALNECRDELLREGKPVAEKIEVGIMVEVPSAAILAAEFASLVDFFSIGTNDLTQYTLAADRTNPELAGLANAFSPAVLRLIDQVIQAAHHARKWVGVCGELAGEPLALPILLGLGLDEFSMNPPAIPLAKQVLRRLNARACQDLAREALTESCAQDVKDLVVGSFPWVVQ